MKYSDPRLKSKWYRLTHLYKILDKQGRLVTFKPSRVQLMILAALGKRLRAKIVKYRQGGVTTLFCILYLDDAVWTPGHSSAIIAHDQATLDKIFEIVERAYENMPETVKPKTSRDTLRMLKFQTTADGQKLDSEIYVALKLRGGTVQSLHVTERAYIVGDKSRELESGSKEAVPFNGRITEETTANGFNEFYDSFMEDYDHPSDSDLDSMALFFAWHEDPQYSLPGVIDERSDEQNRLDALVYDNYGYHLTDGQILWYFWKMRNLEKAARSSEDIVALTGRQLMLQEYPTTLLEAFQSGAGSVFDQQLLEATKPKPYKVVASKKVPGVKVKIWYDPIKQGDKYTDEEGNEKTRDRDMMYAAGVDPSDGTGSDNFGFAIWDENHRQVAQASGQLRPDKIADLAVEFCEMYNEALLGVENNMLSTILFVSKIYKNYFSTVKIDERRQLRTKKMGWTTTQKSRDLMIDEFVIHFEEGEIEINSSLTISEMRTFVVKEGGKREHADGKHDDALFADMIAIQMLKYAHKKANRSRAFSGKPQGL